ncbi:tetratricopeptide repeat protein, partial [Myxococcota bacterium]|nr:tetratricopeptide repeat protein [Myxococcota bacterium]
LQQALEEINQAMDDPGTEIQARLLAGKCYMELGDLSRSANELKRALHTDNMKPSEEMDLYYELGRVYEKLKDLPEAMYYFKKVQRRDASYRGVSEILARLDH